MDNKDNKAGKLIFEINNGGEQTWNQSVRDGSVIIESRHGDEVAQFTIPAGDMVMIANYYRYIKETNENISFYDYACNGVRPEEQKCIQEDKYKEYLLERYKRALEKISFAKLLNLPEYYKNLLINTHDLRDKVIILEDIAEVY